MPNGLPSCFAALCALALVSVVGADARAAETGARAAAPALQGATIILAGGDPATAAALKQALRASLQRLRVPVTFVERKRMNPREVAAPPTRRSLGRLKVWLDLSRPQSATLYVTQADRVFVRRLNFDHPFDSVALDFVDVVVTSSIQAAMEGQHTGMSRDEFRRSLEEEGLVSGPGLPASGAGGDVSGSATGTASTAGQAPAPEPTGAAALAAEEPAASGAAPPPAVRPAIAEETSAPAVTSAPPADDADGGSPVLSRTAADPAPLRWSMATFYEGTLLSPTRAMHGPGVLMDVQRGATRLAFSFHGRLPYEEAGGGATVRIAAEGFRVSVGAVSFLRPTLAAFASLGVGADVTHIRTTVPEGELMARPGRWTVDPVIRPSVGIEAHRGRWRASVSAGIDVDLIGGHYLTRPDTGGTQSVWVPWRWRPYAALAIGLAL